MTSGVVKQMSSWANDGGSYSKRGLGIKQAVNLDWIPMTAPSGKIPRPSGTETSMRKLASIESLARRGTACRAQRLIWVKVSCANGNGFIGK